MYAWRVEKPVAKLARGLRFAPCGPNVTFRFTRHAGDKYLERWSELATADEIKRLLAYPNARDDQRDPGEPREKTHRFIRLEHNSRFTVVRAVLAWAPARWPDGKTAVPGSSDRVEIQVVTLMPTNL